MAGKIHQTDQLAKRSRVGIGQVNQRSVSGGAFRVPDQAVGDFNCVVFVHLLTLVDS
jgi:hypothetical protein